MEFAKFMATPLGRALRIIPGFILLYLGFMGGMGWTIGVIGVVLVASGALNYCALAKLAGGPLNGRDTR